MTTFYRRRQYRDKHAHRPATPEKFHASNRYIGVLCVMSAVGTALVLLTWWLGQPFLDAIFGGGQ